jgi:hypothetical protein
VLTTSSKKERLAAQIRAFTEVKELTEEQVREIGEAGKKAHHRVFVSRASVSREPCLTERGALCRCLIWINRCLAGVSRAGGVSIARPRYVCKHIKV